MNTLREAPAHSAEAVDLRHDGGGIRKANRSRPNQGYTGLRWLNPTVRMIEFRRYVIDLSG
jgi:hypothetical protein